MDKEEIYAPIQERFWLVTVLVALLITGAGASVTLFWRQHYARFHLKHYETERQHLALARRYENLTRHANDIILLTDDRGKIIEANDRALSSYRYALDEMLQMSLEDLQSPEAISVPDRKSERADEVKGVLFETMHRCKDGTRFPVEVSVHGPLRGKGRDIACTSYVTSPSGV